MMKGVFMDKYYRCKECVGTHFRIGHDNSEALLICCYCGHASSLDDCDITMEEWKWEHKERGDAYDVSLRQ